MLLAVVSSMSPFCWCDMQCCVVLAGFNRFEAINVAMGNTRIAPYSFCVDAHAGVDADIISWEMVSASMTDPKAPAL